MATILQTVFRAGAAQDNYTVISNKLLRDPRLKADVRGFIVSRLSYPKDWMIKVGQIIKEFPEGKDRVYRIIKDACELGYMGYLVAKDEQGKIVSHIYYVTDDPAIVVIPTHTSDGVPLFKPTSGKSGNGKNTTSGLASSGKSGSGKITTSGLARSGKPGRILKNDKKQKNVSPSECAREPEKDLDLKAPPQNRKIYNPKDWERKHKLPVYWQVGMPLRNWAKNGIVGASDTQIDEQGEWFREHHVSRGTTMKDWNLAFQTWMRKAKEYGHLGMAGRKSNSYLTGRDEHQRAMERAKKLVRADNGKR